MKKAYYFDFDGTITKKDTMFLFLKHYNAQKFLLSFALHTPLFILLKLKLADPEKVKKSFISSILKGEKKATLDKFSKTFFEIHFPSIIRENALDFLEKRDLIHTDSYLVTASLDVWVKPFAEYFKMNLVATKAEYKEEVFTGNFLGKNCNGEEKVNRLKEIIKNKNIDKSIAFGDTAGDQAMLDFADEGHFRFFS